jgi:hypothetical protein
MKNLFALIALLTIASSASVFACGACDGGGSDTRTDTVDVPTPSSAD